MSPLDRRLLTTSLPAAKLPPALIMQLPPDFLFRHAARTRSSKSFVRTMGLKSHPFPIALRRAGRSHGRAFGDQPTSARSPCRRVRWTHNLAFGKIGNPLSRLMDNGLQFIGTLNAGMRRLARNPERLRCSGDTAGVLQKRSPHAGVGQLVIAWFQVSAVIILLRMVPHIGA
jgi:hypothetical protein